MKSSQASRADLTWSKSTGPDQKESAVHGEAGEQYDTDDEVVLGRNPADVAQSISTGFSQAKDETGFPFPIVADRELDTFRAYRAYDDFEGMTLHGLFLVDAGGQVRWQNISYEPFTELSWLLEESKRLLAIPSSDPKAAAAAGSKVDFAPGNGIVGP